MMNRRARVWGVLALASLLAASCSGGGDSGNVLTSTTGASSSTIGAVPTTVTSLVPSSSPTTSTVTSPPPPDSPWAQEDLPHVAGVSTVQLAEVALVESGDVLNARLGAGVDAEVYVGLEPGVTIILTGAEEVVSGSVWSEIETYVGPLWVNSHFLAMFAPKADFASDPAVEALLDRFEQIIVDRGDLHPVVSRRGLYVSHNDSPRRFRTSTLNTILTDPTTYYWASGGASAAELESSGVPGRTFVEAVADSFVGAYADSDVVKTFDEPISGGNGRLDDGAIPFELGAFNYVGVHDPGDDPGLDGLDWITWYVSIDYENGSPVIVGLTIDQWSP